MTSDGFTIEVGEVSDLEARVIVRFSGDGAELRGRLLGPYCEKAHTLPAEYPLVRLDSQAAEATVTDPCGWSPELPHLYRVEVEAVREGAVVAEYHGELGLRRTTPLKNWDHIK
ncbi:MAG: hypothetical protein AB7G28_22530 [Pirellulales bacterium]